MINHPDVLPATSQTPRRPDGAVPPGDTLMAADLSKGPHAPGLGEFQQMADPIDASGYYGVEELMGASKSERAQLYKILSGGRAGWARLLR